jgi:hypothetical protein
MKEMKVREYGQWSSYTYTKQNKETSCISFKWSMERIEERIWWR